MNRQEAEALRDKMTQYYGPTTHVAVRESSTFAFFVVVDGSSQYHYAWQWLADLLIEERVRNRDRAESFG